MIAGQLTLLALEDKPVSRKAVNQTTKIIRINLHMV
jgi:hypothetical protein